MLHVVPAEVRVLSTSSASVAHASKPMMGSRRRTARPSRTEQGRVEQGAFEIGRLVVEHDRLADLEAKDPLAKRDTSTDEVVEAIFATATSTSHYRPSSLAGAMFQTMMAAADIDNIVSCVPEENRSGTFRSMVAEIERRLRGVVDYLEGQSGTPLAQVGGDFYYQRDFALNPFAHTDFGPRGHACADQPTFREAAE